MGLIAIFFRDINEWIDKKCLIRLMNNGYFESLPKGTYRQDIEKTFYIENNTNKDWMICIEELEDIK